MPPRDRGGTSLFVKKRFFGLENVSKAQNLELRV